MITGVAWQRKSAPLLGVEKPAAAPSGSLIDE